MKLAFLLTFLFCIQTTAAFAYLDPGSGSIILQALLFILAGIGTFFAYFKMKIKKIIGKFKKNEKK
mgnify:CR=1 FL=1|jgi:hypothetical protein